MNLAIYRTIANVSAIELKVKRRGNLDESL